MIEAFVAGVAAGYGIAIPVGAIAILILEAGLRRGFRVAAAAGAGTAAADGLYAALAAAFGAAVAAVVAPWDRPLRAVAVAVLVLIATRGLLTVRREVARRPSPALTGYTQPTGQLAPAGEAADSGLAAAGPSRSSGRGATATFLAFLGLTLLNPMTVVFFGALVLGLPAAGAGGADPMAKGAFVAGVFLASLSWQELLAATGAVFHRRLPLAVATAVGVAGNLVVLAFAAVIAAGLAG